MKVSPNELFWHTKFKICERNFHQCGKIYFNVFFRSKNLTKNETLLSQNFQMEDDKINFGKSMSELDLALASKDENSVACNLERCPKFEFVVRCYLCFDLVLDGYKSLRLS